MVSSSVNGMAIGGARQMHGGIASATDMKRNSSNNFSNNLTANQQAVSRQSLNNNGQKSSILMNSGGLAMNIKESSKMSGQKPVKPTAHEARISAN